MIAAGRAAQCGARVILIEKNKTLGKKLLITGKGRCNITNYEPDRRKFLENFGKNGKFLFSILNAFGVEDTLNFFHSRGLKTKVERGNRVFPESDRSLDVLQVLTDFLKENNVVLLKDSKVIKIISSDKKIEKIILERQEIIAKNYIIAVGGLSYPGTGATGDGFKWAKDLGHSITVPEPALVPLIISEEWIKNLQGLSLKNVRISVFQNNKKQDERFGEALFTHEGLSGPIVLDMSKNISKLKLPLKIFIDFKPTLEYAVLDKRIQRDWQKNINKMFKNSLDELLPQKLIPVIVKLSGINPEKKVNLLSKEERKMIIHLLKELPLTVKGISGFDKAIITSGGVALKEITPQTMCSKIIDNLFFAGEILDLDGPTGGYNLQVAWSTGYVAGESAAS